MAQDTGTITFPVEVIDRQAGDFTVDFETVLRSEGKHPEFVDWCSMVD